MSFFVEIQMAKLEKIGSAYESCKNKIKVWSLSLVKFITFKGKKKIIIVIIITFLNTSINSIHYLSFNDGNFWNFK